ncbi:MAG: Rpn family recombination-promoting nuclease/putative transposase [Spirochaetaceae bacterium]|jgi:predicted transposase/invertase (TIGR01784 family)|nr:Rpn family recombination-promoting nuclease/putative transposase [Spirochaetaceae bacterium]
MTIHNSKDNSFKRILGNHAIFVQFLKDYVPLDIWQDLSPDDIEDMSERFVPLFQSSREADTVKRVRLKGLETPCFIIAIVEHQSTIDFNTPFRLLRYITLVLTEYEREANEDHAGLSAAKDFRFPPVLPIVFYDGRSPWTAVMNFKNRTVMREAFSRYIPDFEYCLVELNRYKIEHIVRFKDELAVLMLIDKMDFRDKEEFLKAFPAYMKEMGLKIPENLARLMEDVIRVLLSRLKVPEEQIRETTDLIREKEAARMFDHLVESYFEGQRLAQEAKALEIARNALSEGATVEFVRKITGLDPETVKNLSAQFNGE